MMSAYNKTSALYILPLGLLVLLSGIHFLCFHGGYLGYDELEYARLASLWTDGRFQHDSLYAYRYAGFLPLSFLYLIFGIGDFASFLFSLVFLIAILWITLKWAEPTRFFSGILIGMYLICAPLHLLYLEKPMPDIVTEFGFLLCFFAFFQERFREEQKITKRNVLIFITGFLCVFFSKETFLIIYPYFLFFFIRDILQKKLLQFWLAVFTSLVIFGLVYLALNGYFLNNPLARIDAIFTNRYISECTYELQPFSVVLERISYKLWVEMSRSGFLWPLGFVIVMLFKHKKENEQRFIGVSWLVFLLLANFMTISYTYYVPLCHDPRHFLFILPLGVYLWSKGWDAAFHYTFREKLLVIGVLMVQLLTGLYFNHENTWWLYIPLITAVWLPSIPKLNVIKFMLVVFAMMSVYVQNARYNLTINHHGQKQLIEAVIRDGGNQKWILTDGANTNIGSFYAHYDDKNSFVVFKDYDPNKHKDRDTYIIMNGMTAYLSNTDWDKVPEFVKSAEGNIPVFYKNESGVVYKIPKQKGTR